eukprot:1825884-Amphidinium_carterae.1
MARARFQGLDVCIYDCLKAHVDRAQVQYSDDFDSPINRRQLIEYRDLLRSLNNIQPNMSFKQSHMVSILLQLAAELGVSVDVESWASDQARRIRCMCYHSIQSFIKARGRNSSWCACIFVRAPPPPHSTASGSMDTPAQPTQPADPAEPTLPAVELPAQPTRPADPAQPTQPAVTAPAEPTQPAVRPATEPTGPAVTVPAQPTGPAVTVPAEPTLPAVTPAAEPYNQPA